MKFWISILHPRWKSLFDLEPASTAKQDTRRYTCICTYTFISTCTPKALETIWLFGRHWAMLLIPETVNLANGPLTELQVRMLLEGYRSLCYKKTFIGKNLFSKFRKSQKKSIPKVKVKKKVKLKSQTKSKKVKKVNSQQKVKKSQTKTLHR